MLARHHIEPDQTLVYEHRPDVERTRRHLAWLEKLPDSPPAMVSGNSLTTLAMIRADLDAGMDSFIAFDDFPLAAMTGVLITAIAPAVIAAR